MNTPVLSARKLSVRFQGREALRGVTMDVPRGRVVAVMGRAGAGKTTLLRAFSRMNELLPDASTSGTVLLLGADLYARDVDPAQVRRRVGMVLRQAAPFPRSVFDNVAFGLRAHGVQGDLHGLAEEALTAVGLWSRGAEVLDLPALSLSASEQRRVCIARTLVLKPEVLLLDEPASGLDPDGSARIESLVHTLGETRSVVVATSDHALAGRLSHSTAYLNRGRLIEHADTRELFTNPRHPDTEAYLTGQLP